MASGTIAVVVLAMVVGVVAAVFVGVAALVAMPTALFEATRCFV